MQYPLTARAVVRRVYTDLAVLEPRGGGRFDVVELAEGVSFDEVQERTDAELVPATAPGPRAGEHAHA